MSTVHLPYQVPVRVGEKTPMTPDNRASLASDSILYPVHSLATSERTSSTAVLMSAQERYNAIVHSVYDCRFITASQIQRLHFNQNRTPLTAARICRRVVKRLAERDVLQRTVRRVGGVQAGSTPYVYSLGTHGVRMVTDKRLHLFTQNPSKQFMQHTLALTELYVLLHELKQHSTLQQLKIQTEPECWHQYTSFLFGVSTLKPDMYIYLDTGADKLHYFIEMDRGTVGKTALVKKLRAYEIYYQAGREQQQHGAFPQVVWLVPDNKRKLKLEELCQPFNERMRGLFVIALQENALEAIGIEPP